MSEPTSEQQNPAQPSSEQPSPEPIVVSYTLTSGEYAHYAAAASRRSSSWKSFYVFVAVVFLAIPVALFFRAIAAQSLHNSAAVELVGYFSLCAYETGVAAAMIWGYVVRWILRKRYYEGTVARRELTTAVIDRSQINVTVPGIEAKWQWKAVEGCSIESCLLLVWIGPSQAAAIPCRSFESRDSCNKAVAFIRARLLEAKRPVAQPLA
jgi:hypothetical protein